ncbi:ABC transporter permease [Streptomyces filipinensis]|uniref:ABC transporter permease n=1 Tax=Streptomyces filipinensis TaxID=66887 RepID=A0A918IDC9_9ACTN|nr:ABC transporter permease [Streptomyces filipinensis]GGV04409.1 ABC transporter permease [Streptomyces filipinensis]
MLVLANVRERWSGFLAAFAAVLVGVALVTTTLTIYESSLPEVRSRLSAAAVIALPERAVDEDGSPEDRVPWSRGEAQPITDGLREVPGVASVVVDRSFYAQAFRGDEPVRDEGAEEAGHGWSSVRLAPYRLVSGRAPASDGEVVVDRSLGVAAGSSITVNITAGRTRFRVAGTVDGPGYYFTDDFAAHQQPGVTAIALLTAKDVPLDTVKAGAEAVVGAQASVVTGDGRSALQPAYVTHKRFLGTQLIGAMAALGLFTTVFLVASLLVLATGLRRRELALLRLIGATPRQVRGMLLGEALVIGLLGSVAGCLAGIAAAPLLQGILRGLDVAPPGVTLRVAPWPLCTAAATGVAVSVAGAWAAGRTAAGVAPTEALLDSRAGGGAMSRTRWIAGAGVLGIGVVLAIVTASVAADRRIDTAILATMVFIVAAALLAPVLVGPVGRLLTKPFERSGSAIALLVRAELHAHPRRAASLAAPVIAAVGFAVVLSGMVETMRVAYPAGDALRLRGQVIVTPDGTPGNTDEVVAANPVGKAAVPTRAFVRDKGGRRSVIDVLGSRDPRWDRPGQAVLGARMASFLGVRAGDEHDVRFADGATVRLRIARVLPDAPARGDFVVARSLVRRHDPAALTDDIFVPAGAKATAVPGSAVHDAMRYALDDYDTDARLTDSLAALLIVIAVGYSGIAVANSTGMSAHSRGRDFRVLGSAGGTVAQLLVLSVAESSLVATVGAALGVLVTLGPLAGMASGLSQATSTDVRLHLDVATVASVAGGSVLLSVVASVAVTWRGTRRRTGHAGKAPAPPRTVRTG